MCFSCDFRTLLFPDSLKTGKAKAATRGSGMEPVAGQDGAGDHSLKPVRLEKTMSNRSEKDDTSVPGSDDEFGIGTLVCFLHFCFFQLFTTESC